ncbi:cobalt-precorrin 5A hydrolase [Methanothermococcus sp.]|uniref:cobalt-precorrin 5A hydrolase n=1 Tax=Methanothermococcus sp. TaxID=2614238 RepID=UPI0025FD07D3|nr:cobalamin biosynthesis protein [Methanothermococcus sp.]
MIKIAYITKNGEILANKIKHILDYYFYDNEIYHSRDLTTDGNEKGFIFIMATGIVLRKYIDKIKKDKTKDAFVIVLDELGKNIIPILSNHLGGGNYFSKLIGRELKGNIIFTTATDVNNKVGIDELSNIYFLDVPEKKDILKINKKVLNEKVDLILPSGWKPLKNVLNTYNVEYHNNNYVVVDGDIVLKPKKIVVGIGARKNIKSHKVYWAVKKALYLRDIPVWRVDAFATVDVKKDERGILETAERFKKDLFIFDRGSINEIYNFRDDLTKSDFVFKTIGVYGVSEPVSILGVKKLNDSMNNIGNIKNINIDINRINLILKKFKKNGVSVSISIG